MPRGLRNWSFTDVARFLRTHGFIQTHSRGSHFYYVHSGSGPRQVCIPFHGGGAIHPRVLKSIIRQSGIPEIEWREFAGG
ncbi:MAG: type II toxin-antitoxin system HicA family toxin [Candidatus Liptonbacteria bacterium]